MARKRGMQFIPYDYEAAYNKAMRRYCDTDDIEATEFGKENAVDD